MHCEDGWVVWLLGSEEMVRWIKGISGIVGQIHGYVYRKVDGYGWIDR